MRQPWEWNENVIIALIRDGVKESIALDYKRCDSLANTDGKKKEISKDISAFANSAGGTVVYGIIENNHLPGEIDIGYDPNEISREWLEQVINSRIQRRIDGIRINQIELSGDKLGKVIYAVYIPQSNRAPHMADNNRFYKRFNFQSVPMEEYEVRDVSRRFEMPDLKIQFSLEENTLLFENGKDCSKPISLYCIISNESSMPAEYVVIDIIIDNRLISTSTEFTKSDNISYTHLSMNWSIPGKMPIWEGMMFRVSKKPILIQIPKEPGEYILSWFLKSPKMSPKEKVLKLISDGQTIRIDE